MKFCKNLQRVVDIADPEWAPYWTNYKMLKKLIKELPSLVPAEDNVGKNVADLGAGSSFSGDEAVKPGKGAEAPESMCSSTLPAIFHQKQGDRTTESKIPVAAENSEEEMPEIVGSQDQKEDLSKSPGEIAFFKLLHAEFNKASRFFDKTQQEFTIREERVREGMEIMKRPNSIMVNEKWSLLAKSIYRLYKDLLLFETFAIMTYCSFSKILKKHDKVTGHHTRAAFMSNVVNKSNFASYPAVLAMISRCEAMYEDVSALLQKEGKVGLYEDERLFISMVNRLNSQAFDVEDVPDRRRRAKPGISLGRRSSNQPESIAVSTLRELVEESEARKLGHIADPTDGNSESKDEKRSAKDADLSNEPDRKRAKKP